MAHLIDKAALVAEIERIEQETNYEPFTDEVLGKRCTCRSLLSFLNTLEVKEVDLKKEIAKYLGDDWKQDTPIEVQSDMIGYAKHFFELGLKMRI